MFPNANFVNRWRPSGSLPVRCCYSSILSDTERSLAYYCGVRLPSSYEVAPCCSRPAMLQWFAVSERSCSTAYVFAPASVSSITPMICSSQNPLHS